MLSLLVFAVIATQTHEFTLDDIKWGLSDSGNDSDDNWEPIFSSSSDSETDTKTDSDTSSGTDNQSDEHTDLDNSGSDDEDGENDDLRCENLPAIPYGRLNTTKKSLRIGDTASIICDKNYCLSQYNDTLNRGHGTFTCTERMAKDDRYCKIPVCIQDWTCEKNRYFRRPTYSKTDPIPDDDFITAIKNGLKSTHSMHYGHLKWSPQLERRSEVQLYKSFSGKLLSQGYKVKDVRFNGKGLCDRHVASSYIAAVLQQPEHHNFIKGSAKLFGCGVWDSPTYRNRVHCQYYAKL